MSGNKKRGSAIAANPLCSLYFDSSGTILKHSNGTIIVVAFHKQFVGNFCVSLGHLQIGVSHLPLKGKQIAAVFKVEGSKTVSDLIGRELHTCPFTILSEIPSQNIGLQLLSIPRREQPLFPFLRLHLQEFLQGSVGHGRQIQGSASARFGNIRTNQDGLRFRIVVLVCDCHEFACPYSSIKHQQHNVIVPKFGKIVLVQSLEKSLNVLDFRRLDISFISHFLQLELLEGVVGKVVLFGTPFKQGMEILVRVIEPRRTCFGDVSKVFQNFDLQHINIQGILRLSKKLVDVLFVVAQSSLTDFLSLFRARNSLATSRSVRSSQTIFIRIFYTSQFVKTVGLEDVFGFAEIHILNFLTNKKGNSRRNFMNSQSWQGH